MALSALFWYHCSMESKVKTTSTADEMITISRAEYEALKEHNAELEQKLNWLTEQYILAKHGKYAFASEQQEQLVMDGFGRTLNEVLCRHRRAGDTVRGRVERSR